MIFSDQDAGTDSGNSWSVAAGKDSVEGSL
jgi:hypothetical protein